MQKQTIPFQNKSLAFYSNNAIDKQPIIFIHGNSMSSKIWSKQFESSLSDNFYLIALDLPGHGESDNYESYDLKMLSSCISTLVNNKALKNYVLVGNSLGGDLILQVLSQLINCKGIVLLNTPPVSKPPAMDRAFLPNPIIGMLFAKDYDKANVTLLADAMFNDNTKIPYSTGSDFERADGTVREALAVCVGTGNYIDEVTILETTLTPVAIISGMNEKIVNNTYYDSLKIKNLWENKIHLIEHSAHCPQWENSIEFNRLLNQFCT